MSNDSKEGELIREILVRIAKQANLPPSVVRNIDDSLKLTYDFFDGLGFCLSEHGDLLSQWRGYADDGRGVSIGFDSDYLETLASIRKEREEASFTLRELVYDSSLQEKIAQENFEELKPLLEQGELAPVV